MKLKRLARGLRLNHVEATALIATVVLEFIRDGKTCAELMDLGRKLLGKRQVLEGVEALCHEVQVEGTFPDGTKLVTVHSPITLEDGDLDLALYGSFLPKPSLSAFDAPGSLILNKDRESVSITVTNLADRPIQVGSHYHFVEANSRLEFDRGLAYGKRLNITAGTAVRFEPGESKVVSLVAIGGNKVIRGGNNIVDGPYSPSNVEEIVKRCAEKGFKHKPQDVTHTQKKAKTEVTIDRKHYADIFGPTTGDKVHLGDTGLVIEVEKDYTVYGDECKFGGGKVVDYTGIYKCDIGIKDGKIAGIGKAGNPDGVTPGMTVGPGTEAIAGEGSIVTAGVTTLYGGGSGPATGTNATTCTDGSFYTKMMLQATDNIPLNFGFSGKGNASKPEGLREMIEAGCAGLKLHEDWGTTPAAIDSCLSIAEEYDIQVTIHTDTLNESCCVEDTIAAFKGRTIHTYHSEGAGGGHAPDIIKVCSQANVIASSTNPTKPFTINTIDEHVDMLMVCHHLDKNISEDVAFAESRIRDKTIQAEDILHDMGAICIMSSDSQAMGRIGEVIARTWQTAAKMKQQRGTLPEDKESDNLRVKRYIAKYTINPAIAHGFSQVIGSIEVGKMADLVIWKPEFFGAKPEMMGDPNASIPTPQPVMMRPMFGSFGPKAIGQSCVTFVSQVSLSKGIVASYGLQKRAVAVTGTRTVGKKDMKYNDATPSINVNSETYVVTADGVELSCAPADRLPLAQRYFLF
ncbi:hypothetical protein GUITHDRAFT_116849 [Guillardia theta CCMP2712]|uniref:urease n=1 Tax=Guillardia theta (strain CCMP2712) TaxID=905079 RepID=L1IL47_GUITC|nr:hypothetical protein GUITHDRAFT_116849 [Guillardia theta CCMP2712]EKX36983.1 hypothetical protein GUITHDRAFT_116849 [Guillardia theta CCMP2712]|eukprot:XP_005823963.1 hypothetical protein GUITHDRAFT_116849 [Guillardia theta CCMP2712]